MRVSYVLFCLWAAPTVAGCNSPESAQVEASAESTRPQSAQPLPVELSESAGWLGSTEGERLEAIARHLRGMDMAMAETGYRYAELYWAGEDRNWEYANYQLTKIELALTRGVERRPKRAASAKVFAPAAEPVRAAIEKEDAAAFSRAFASLTTICNSCHQAERVGFMRVVPPETRSSVIRGPLQWE